MMTSLARLFFPTAEESCSALEPKPALNRAAGPTLCTSRQAARGSPAPLARTSRKSEGRNAHFALHNLGPAASYARYADQEPQLCEAGAERQVGFYRRAIMFRRSGPLLLTMGASISRIARSLCLGRPSRCHRPADSQR